MASDIEELNSITHEYRKSLDAFQRRTGLAPQTVDHRGSGEEREKFARMDADLDAAELRTQNAALEARLAKLEKTPVFTSKLAERKHLDSDQRAMRWLQALAAGDAQEFRALSTGSSNAAIPTDLERRIVEKRQMSGVIRGLAKVNTINSDRKIAIENALPTSEWITEGSSQTATDPTFSSQITVNPLTMRCSTILSQQFIEDAIGTGDIGTGMEYVSRKIAMSMALKEEEAFTVGGGSTEPRGVATATIAQVTDLGSGVALTTTTADNIIDTVHLVAPEYRVGNFSWLISDSFVKHIRKMKSTQDYIWLPAGTPNTNALVAGAAGTIYGVPYRVGKYVPVSTADAAVYAVVGNFDFFEIFDRTGMTALMDPYSLQANLQTRLNVFSRTDSAITLPAAFAAIIG
jgi:HK97 family phage major capsid protein